MVSNFTDPHLCPVCWHNWVHGQRIYCSDQCRREASNFLNRTYFLRANLGELGFTLTKSDGIFFTIRVPRMMEPYLPSYNHEFCFPAPGLSVEALGQEALYDTVEEFVGPYVTSLIREYCNENYSSAPRTVSWFHKMCFAGYSHPAHSTFCSKCCVKRLTTEAGWDPQNDCCTDCSIIAIPF